MIDNPSQQEFGNDGVENSHCLITVHCLWLWKWKSVDTAQEVSDSSQSTDSKGVVPKRVLDDSGDS